MPPRPPLASRNVVSSLMSRLHKTHCGCPICSPVTSHSSYDISNALTALRTGGRSKVTQRGYATPVEGGRDARPQPQGDYAFEVAASNLRYGEGVTRVSFSLQCSLPSLPPTIENSQLTLFPTRN
jgi:hydroxyacid-oxoacid transhydrogenase